MSLRTIRSAVCSFVLVAELVTPLAAQSTGPVEYVPKGQLTGPGTTTFGGRIVLSGDDLVTRSEGEQHVFHRSAGTWSLQASFTNPEGWFFMGPNETADSIEGDLLLIGIPFSIHGSVKLYERTGATFGAPTTLSGPVPGDHDYYGHATLVRDGLVFVGMPDYIGAEVQIRRKVAGIWKIVGSVDSPISGSRRGSVLRTSGSRLLVGEQFGVNLYTQGASPVQWTFDAHLAAPGGTQLGSSSIDGDTVVLASGNSAASPAFVYEDNGFAWAQTGALSGHDVPPGQAVRSVLVRGQTAYIGRADAVYVFQRFAAGWVETAKILPPAGLPPGSGFGRGLATDGATLFVGAPGSGSIELFGIETVVAPMAYCTAKLNSQGCLPAMGATGVPSASSPSPFVLDASHVINQKPGLLVYTTSGSANTPFQGGTLCVAQPLRRTQAQSSGGNVGPDDCSGSYAFDFNAWVGSGADPALVPGAQVWAQFYSRDPMDPFQVGLSDAIAFTIGS